MHTTFRHTFSMPHNTVMSLKTVDGPSIIKQIEIQGCNGCGRIRNQPTNLANK